ncbi:MAG: response regulator transcription factor [Gammaproteobacteria bacterium]
MRSDSRHPTRRTVLIVDDHPILRRGLAALIESEPDLVVGAEAADCKAAIDAFGRVHPDLVIVDLALGDDDGFNLVVWMHSHHPDTPALVLSMYEESVFAERSLRAGARGYINKTQLDDTFVTAMRRLLNGGTYMSTTLQEQLAGQYIGARHPATGSPVDGLSDRELQVFRMIGDGQTTREIAQHLNLSVKTIETHRSHIKSKLGLASSAALAHSASQWVGSLGRAG